MKQVRGQDSIEAQAKSDSFMSRIGGQSCCYMFTKGAFTITEELDEKDEKEFK